MKKRNNIEVFLPASMLHLEKCPVCGGRWDGLLNDLERLAHLICHSITAGQLPRG
jgi:hypothetical protein